jgi:hypothetical protein
MLVLTSYAIGCNYADAWMAYVLVFLARINEISKKITDPRRSPVSRLEHEPIKEVSHFSPGCNYVRINTQSLSLPSRISDSLYDTYWCDSTGFRIRSRR